MAIKYKIKFKDLKYDDAEKYFGQAAECFRETKNWSNLIQFNLTVARMQLLVGRFDEFDKYLKDAGFDLFEDVIDTSFYKTGDLDKKFEIFKENFDIIENDLTIDGRFRDDIWKRLKTNQSIFMDGWDKYFWKKYKELK